MGNNCLNYFELRLIRVPVEIIVREYLYSIEIRIFQARSTFPSSLPFLPPTGNVKSLARIDYTTQISTSFLT